MDVSAYRQQYERELERANVKITSYSDFLNKSRSSSERIESLSGDLTTLSEDEINESINIILDRQEDVRIRSAALRSIGNALGDREQLIDIVIGILTNEAAYPTLQVAALDVLQILSFSSSILKTKRPEYLAALRTLIDCKNTNLRQKAIEILAIQKDEYVQRRLLDGLEGRAKAIVNPAKAIQLLGYDIHAEYYTILHRIVEHPPSRTAQREAIRLLASDPSSSELLAQILTNKNEHPSIRRRSAISLESIAPERFAELAKQTILDDREDNKLRATCIKALEYSSHQQSLGRDLELNQKIQQLKTETSSRYLKQAIISYMSQPRN